MAKEINVEDIMHEIREEIKQKGYTNDMLSFSDIAVDISGMNINKYDELTFGEEIYDINHSWEVQSYRPLFGNKAAVFFKKCIRKMVYFFVDPIVTEQNGVNASAVRLFNQVGCFIDEQRKENEELKAQIADLKQQLEQLQK